MRHRMTNLGDVSRFLRKAHGYTVSDMARMLGMSTGKLSEIENKKRPAGQATLDAMKRAFGISPNWLSIRVMGHFDLDDYHKRTAREQAYARLWDALDDVDELHKEYRKR